MIISIKETHNQINISLKKPDLRYLDEFVKCKCSSDLLSFKLFPNAKEISESFGAYNAIRRYLQKEFPLNNKKTSCIVIGDGHTPRTGATIVFRTLWKVISIDPVCKKINNIKRLTVISKKIEEVNLKFDKIIIICVHSHASLISTVKNIVAKEKWIISIPCCKKDDLPILPIYSYEDWGILSEKRTVNIYYMKGARHD